MRDFPHIPADATPAQRFSESAQMVRALTGAARVIVIAQDADGVSAMVSAGFGSHLDVTVALALGGHLNLKDYDARAAAGELGQAAQDLSIAAAAAPMAPKNPIRKDH